MNKLNYLNVGCGDKIHDAWVNIDLASNDPRVIVHNLLKGIPYKDNTFDVVYHSQVLEHFPKDKAPGFIKECYRVLKPGGILRVVVPDLENIVNEYKKQLSENLNNHSELAEANYDWIMLEMYDQTVRNYSGGQMAKFLEQPQVINEKYIIDRTGFVTKSIREKFLKEKGLLSNQTAIPENNSFLEKIKRNLNLNSIRNRILNLVLSKKEREDFKNGKFRSAGEIHLWMYDRYSLKRLLQQSGFEQIEVKSPLESNIANWSAYELDVKNGYAFDPTSLFMEGKKPS